MEDVGDSKVVLIGHTNDSSSDDACFDDRTNHPETTKRRPCSRKLSSMPGKKYLCQKNSADHNFCSESNDGGIGSMDSRDENHLESDDEINIHEIPCYCKGCTCSHRDEDDLYYLQSTPQYLENGKAYDSDQMEWKFQSPCAISSWGHFCQSRRDYYKYRRSDYSSDSDDETVPRFNLINHDTDGCVKPRSHLPVCDTLSELPLVCKNVVKCASKSDLLKTLTSRPQDGIKPNVFKEKFATILRWFSECSDDQKNTVLKGLLMYCDLPQMHLLSVKLGPNLHQGCPTNCQDILTWLPTNLAHKIMSYFDPVTLCRASQACCHWRQLAEEPSLWRKFCCQQKWRLSKAAEHKQVISHMSPEGSIMWKKVFAERYRLRQNWLNGRCTVRTFEGHSQGISCVQFDDTRIVSGSSDKTIKVWNIRTNAPWSVQTLVGHSGTVRCLHLEGKRLVSGSTDKSIKVWDLSTQESWSSIACKVTMVGHEDTVRCIQVDDDKVISGSYDFTIKVWDIKTGSCRMTLRGHQAAVLCVQFNDTKIVSGSCDKAIKIWGYGGECIRTLTGHQDAVTCLQFDSTRIVSGSMDCNLKIWDIHSGDCINTIDWKASEGHTGVVRCLQADSWRLCSAADDKTIKVWNLQTGERLVTLRNHTDGVTCLQFNDFIIVSGSYDKTVKLWDFSCC